MAWHWRAPATLRADPPAGAAARPSPRQSVALIAVLVLVAGAVAAASALISPERAATFDLFHGSLLLADDTAPVAIDLASGRPTVRLADANVQVGAKNAADVSVVPLTEGALLLNRNTGEFNMVDSTGFVVKTNGGVRLQKLPGSTGAVGIASNNYAYVEQTGPTGTSVYLVGTATVQSASNAATMVKPRAFRWMRAPGTTDPGGAATAGDDLWLLVGTGNSRTVRHLHLPAHSSPGVTLAARDEGTVAGPAAIGTARGGGSAPTVGVASADRLTIFRGSGKLASLRWKAPNGVDKVLPATNGTGRLSFLLHGSDGWRMVSSDLAGKQLHGPTRLSDIASTAQLVSPAASNGDLYTMDTISGQLIRIDGGGHARALDGARGYPLTEQNGRSIESGGFGDAYAIARGSRVVFNSPNHLQALVVFTDGTHPPLRIEKSSAVIVNAAAGVASLTRARRDSQDPKPPPPGKAAAPKAADPVNNKIDCRTTAQKPHIPQLGQPVTGSRSVLLTWTYPVTGQQDCVPSTYVLHVTALSAGAPSAPSDVRVQGQRSLNLSGLFPSTRYEITVTAYLNGRGTESPPIQITTGQEGPAAPLDVSARADSAGNWNVSWSSCGGTERGCVPTQSWTVIPQFCDGRGLSAPPSPIDVPADPTAVQQPGATVPGGDALLGRGMRFVVEGVGVDGSTGAASAPTACTTSWRPSLATGMRLAASTPNDAPVGGTSSTTVALDLGANAVHNVGGVGAQIVLSLSGPDGTRTSTSSFDGRSSTIQMTFTGVRPGVAYTASATVSPPGHPGSGVGLGPVAITSRADWPALGVQASCPTSELLFCTLTLKINGVTSSDVGGEHFDLADGSVLQCGQAALVLSKYDFDPADILTFPGVSQVKNLFGNCKVVIRLVESSGSGPTPYFGGHLSGTAWVGVDLGQPDASGAGSGDFSASWIDRGGSSAQVEYTGTSALSDLTTNWTETLKAPDGTVCGSGIAQPGKLDATAAVIGASAACVQRYGNAGGWSVDVAYDDLVGASTHHAFTLSLAGAPPSYQPCTPTGFSASWGPTEAAGVTVARSGGDVGGCSNWTYEVDSPDGAVCTAAADAPTAAPTISVGLNCVTPPSQDNWKVVVRWMRPDGSLAQVDPPLIVGGSPPKI